jgi:hypothetical protein
MQPNTRSASHHPASGLPWAALYRLASSALASCLYPLGHSGQERVKRAATGSVRPRNLEPGHRALQSSELLIVICVPRRRDVEGDGVCVRMDSVPAKIDLVGPTKLGNDARSNPHSRIREPSDSVTVHPHPLGTGVTQLIGELQTCRRFLCIAQHGFIPPL